MAESKTTDEGLVEEKNKEQAFVKSQILKSKKYADNRDLLGAILDDDKSYTHGEINEIIETFKKRGVK